MVDDTKRARGKITMVHPKGYGFIISPDIPFTKFFFHWTALSTNTLNFKEVKAGMEVEFTPYLNEDLPNNVSESTGKSLGPRAVKIVIINSKDDSNALDTTAGK